MRSVLCVEFENDVADMMVDRLDADQEIDGNFLVAFAQSELLRICVSRDVSPTDLNPVSGFSTTPCLNFPQWAFGSLVLLCRPAQSLCPSIFRSRVHLPHKAGFVAPNTAHLVGRSPASFAEMMDTVDLPTSPTRADEAWNT
jgi:hypothetical protein